MVRVLKGLILTAVFWAGSAMLAQAIPTAAPIEGEIQQLTLNDPADVWSGGVMVVGGRNIILPRNLLLDLPANRLSLQQLFAQAPPACLTNGESGLAKGDACNGSGSGGIATLTAVRNDNGNVIAGDVLIQKGIDLVSGIVTYIDYTNGYFRLDGAPGSSTTGAMVRLNDPNSRHTVQQGLGCLGGAANCSPDPRFALDADNYTNVFASGYPLCLPSTVARPYTGLDGQGALVAQSDTSGVGDSLCPDTNRPADPVTTAVDDSRFFAPVQLGDHLTAEGNFEFINGVQFLSSHTVMVSQNLMTKDLPGQPDYLFLDLVEIGVAGYQGQSAHAELHGYTTRIDSDPTFGGADVDFWSIHRDPITNDLHEFPFASTLGCNRANGGKACTFAGVSRDFGQNIFSIHYEVDFTAETIGAGTPAEASPCAQLRAVGSRFGSMSPRVCPNLGTFSEELGILIPPFKEIQSRTGHKLDQPAGSLVTLDISGNETPNGQYLFPFGINLGGLATDVFGAIDPARLATPVIFEGLPWALDRRLSPNGCIDTGSDGIPDCEAAPQPLDPFPVTGLDPRLQAVPVNVGPAGFQGGLPSALYSDPYYTASTLSDIKDRILSYVTTGLTPTTIRPGGDNFDGANTVLAYPPSSPAAVPITETPQVDLTLGQTVVSTPSGQPTAVALTPDLVSPQDIGTTISFTAAALPASGSFEYRFQVNAGGIWSVAQGFSTQSTFGWDTTGLSAGQYFIQVDTRTAGSGVASTASQVVGYFIGANSVPAAATSVTLTPDLASPQLAGTAVTFTAAGLGSPGPFEYRFWLKTGSGWAMVQGYSAANTWNWNPSGVVGIYAVQVDVRALGSTVVRDTAKAVFYTLVPPPATGTTLGPDLTSPQSAGTPLSFTAAGQGGSGSYEYRFWLKTGATWAVVQAYSANDTWSWNPSGIAGDYFIQVDVRSQGSVTNREAAKVLGFVLN